MFLMINLLILLCISPVVFPSLEKDASKSANLVPIPISDILLYYLSVPPGAPGYDKGTANYLSMKTKREKSLKRIELLDGCLNWDLALDLFCALKVPIKDIMVPRGKNKKLIPGNKDDYVEFLNLIMASSFAIHYQLPYVVFFEDDVILGASFKKQLQELAVFAKLMEDRRTRTVVVDLNDSGKAWFFTNKGARHFLNKVYQKGIDSTVAVWIKKYLAPSPWKLHIDGFVEGNIKSVQPAFTDTPFQFVYAYKPSLNAHEILQYLSPKPDATKTLAAVKGNNVGKAFGRPGSIFNSQHDTNFTKIGSRFLDALAINNLFDRELCYKDPYRKVHNITGYVSGNSIRRHPHHNFRVGPKVVK